MKVRLAEEADLVAWDRYATLHPETSPYHLSGWKAAIELAYGHKGHYLLAEQEDNICGVLPLVQMKVPFGKPHYCALPFCDVGHALADNEDIKQQLESSAIELTKHHIELRDVDSNKMPSAKVRMLLALPETSDELWNGFKSKLRSQVRKAEKNGLTFAVGEGESGLKAFYQVFAKNMRELGSPVHSYAWFEALLKAYGDNLMVGLVHKGKEVTGAGILLFAGDKVSIPWASTLREYNRLAPNMLLYWNLLRISCERNCREFDFGRSTFNEGTYKFKSQWGAAPLALDWKVWHKRQRQDAEPQAGNAQPSTAKAKLRELIEATWRNLPLDITIKLGPALRKYISL